MNIRKAIMGTAIAGLVFGALAVGGAANADAYPSYSNGGILRTNVTYISSTNKLSVYDAYADGWGGRAQWNTNGGASGTHDNILGVGTSTSTTTSGAGTTITLRACAINNGVNIGCSPWTSTAF